MPLKTLAGFNPRAREGRDQREPVSPGGFRVSIHAPVKDATLSTHTAPDTSVFQSTRP